MSNLTVSNNGTRPRLATMGDIVDELLWGVPSVCSPDYRESRSRYVSGLRLHGPYRDEGSIYAEVEVPGIDPSEITVQVEGKAVQVRTPKGHAYFSAGERLNSEDATATLKHGMLTVRVPTREARKIEVKVEVED